MQEGQQELVPFRYDVELESETHGYYPDTLSDDRVSASLKMAELGAIYKGVFGEVAKSHVQIVWEVQINTSPPAKIKPLKPKVWVTAELLMNAGVLYKVE